MIERMIKMMIDPESYKNEIENKNLRELVLIRNELLEDIKKYEENHIINDKPYSSDEIVKPSPELVYEMNNKYLLEITKLIISKK